MVAFWNDDQRNWWLLETRDGGGDKVQMDDALRHLGEQGWDLVSVVPVHGTSWASFDGKTWSEGLANKELGFRARSDDGEWQATVLRLFMKRPLDLEPEKLDA